MKRDYRYGSVFGLVLINSFINIIFNFLFEDNGELLAIPLTAIVSYIICAGLLNTRNENFKEYFMNIKTIDVRFFFVKILLVAMLGIIDLSAFFLLFASAFKSEDLSNISIITIILFMLFNIGYYYITCYDNFILADENFKELGFLQTTKCVVGTGIRLIGKTLIITLKYFGVPFVGLIALIVSTLSEGRFEFLAMGVILVVGFLLFYVFIIPSYYARLSDIYLDYIDKKFNFNKLDDKLDCEERVI